VERHAFSPAITAPNPLSFRIRFSGEESAFLCGRSRSVARSRLASPHRTDTFRRGKPPPKRSLDGAPSKVEMNAIARATRRANLRRPARPHCEHLRADRTARDGQ